MRAIAFEIRVCQNCGLRYPLVRDQPSGERCPICLGQTSFVLEQSLDFRSETEHAELKAGVNLRVLLDNIRSAWNVGSIIRSADGFEFQHAYLCGITPAPTAPGVHKTALGAENIVPWSSHKNALDLVMDLREQAYTICALERISNSIPVDDLPSTLGNSTKLVLVVGNEVTGVDPGILRIADNIVHLPMHGQKSSFNVAIAFALAAQHLRTKN